MKVLSGSKCIGAALILCVCSVATANSQPLVGDFAYYSVQAAGSSSVRKQQIERFDSGRDIYTVGNYSVRSDGSEKLLGTSDTLGSSLRKKYISNLDGDCAYLNGTIEEIAVPAGNYNTCRIEETVANTFQITRWLGIGIPLGVVREVTAKISDMNNQRILELQKFGRN